MTFVKYMENVIFWSNNTLQNRNSVIEHLILNHLKSNTFLSRTLIRLLPFTGNISEEFVSNR